MTGKGAINFDHKVPEAVDIGQDNPVSKFKEKKISVGICFSFYFK